MQRSPRHPVRTASLHCSPHTSSLTNRQHGSTAMLASAIPLHQSLDGLRLDPDTRQSFAVDLYVLSTPFAGLGLVHILCGIVEVGAGLDVVWFAYTVPLVHLSLHSGESRCVGRSKPRPNAQVK